MTDSAALEPFHPADTITVLICQSSYFAGKTHTRKADRSPTTIGHQAGKYFTVREFPVTSIKDLHEVLARIGAKQDEFVIRGAKNPLIEISATTIVRRASRVNSNEGEEEPWFVETPRRWVLLDFDGLPNPDCIDPTSREAMAYLRSLLPAEFQDVSCSYSLSSSAGLREDDSIRGHLWFYLDRALGAKELKTWLAPCPVDKSLFNTVQAHFVANPRFTSGRVDPIDSRKGILAGKFDEVQVPSIKPLDRQVPRVEGRQDGLRPAVGYEARMARLGDGPNGEGCHGVITPAIAAYFAALGPSADRQALKADIRAHAAKAQWDRSKHSVDYVAQEISDPVLDRSIGDWIRKVFVIEDAYPDTLKLPLEEGRKKVGETVDDWICCARRWHDQGDYRRALLEGRVELKLDGEEGLYLSYDGPPGMQLIKRTPKSIRSSFPPPRHAIAAQVSLGKTRSIVERLPVLLDETATGHTILITVPNHELSQELAERITSDGLDVEIYRGPAQSDPDAPDLTMCRRHRDFEVFRAAGMGNKLCGVCSHQFSCGFLRQREKKATIWIAAHNILYYARRRPIPPVDFVIMDEDPVGAGYDDGRGTVLKVGDAPSDVGNAIMALPMGEPFTRGQFGVTDARLSKLASEYYSNVCPVELPHNATDPQIEAIREILLANLAEIKKARLFEEIRTHGPFGMRIIYHEKLGIVLSWNRQRRIHKDFNVPTLILDATLRRDMVRHIFDAVQPPVGYRAQPFVDEDGSIAFDYEYPQEPIVGPITEIYAETPAVKIRQVPFSAASSRFRNDRQGSENLRKIRRYIEARAAYVDSTLVICQKALEDKLTELGLPPNVQIAHFNAIRGKDTWGDVDLLIVIGRTQPPPCAVETHAEALFRAPVKTLGGDYYGHVWKPLGGQNRLVQVERHFDPLAELVRWGVCEAELIQAIGRGRAANRTQEFPLQVDLINTVPLPNTTIDEYVEWNNAQPSPVDVVAGRYGLLLPREMVFGMSGILAVLLPDLFSSENAARQAGVHSQADSSNETFHKAIKAREYKFLPPASDLIALKLEGRRYSVPALKLRDASEQLRFEASTLSSSGVLLLDDLPRKWREKLRTPLAIEDYFGLSSLIMERNMANSESGTEGNARNFPIS